MTIPFRNILTRRLIVTLFLGFSSGLPLLATTSTLKVWMTERGIDYSTIGLITLVGLPYTVKFLWAPLMDRFVPPFLGRRRGWMIITQIATMVSLVSMGFFDPLKSPGILASLALMTCFFSASQDIVLDAHRRDTLEDEELGLGSALFVSGYRIGMIVSGALALWLVDLGISWKAAYSLMALGMSVGLVAAFLSPEPEDTSVPQSFKEAVYNPILEFMKKPGVVLVLVFILCYKLGDYMADAMLVPFVLEKGYTKTQFGAIARGFGLGTTIFGGLLGGLILFRVNIKKALLIFGLMQAISTLGFVLLNEFPVSITLLVIIIAFENLSNGMGTSAFVAYLASLTNRSYSATQYALLTSLMGVPRVILSSSTGLLVESVGWSRFFLYCSLMAVPGLLLILLIMKKRL